MDEVGGSIFLDDDCKYDVSFNPDLKEDSAVEPYDLKGSGTALKLLSNFLLLVSGLKKSAVVLLFDKLEVVGIISEDKVLTSDFKVLLEEGILSFFFDSLKE